MIQNKTPHHFPFNLILIGFMGAGKSTVARYLGRTRHMEIIEMDEEIARREQKSIPDIFAQKGEAYFRDVESNLLKELQRGENQILSCGGGIVLRPENITEMKKNGKVILLTASPETVLERVKYDNSRPVLKNRKNKEDIARLMDERRDKYLAAADLVISTDHKSISQICEEILTEVSRFC